METTAKNVILITAKARDYDFEGTKGEQIKGTSYRATLNGGEEVFIMKTDTATYNDIKDLKNQEGTAEIEIRKDIKTGNTVMFLKKFTW